MIIKSFKAPTLKEAMANVKAELGIDAIILHTSRTRKGGILGFAGKEIVEVIAAVEENEVKPVVAPKIEKRPNASFVPKNIVNQYQNTNIPAQNEASRREVSFGDVLATIQEQKIEEPVAPKPEVKQLEVDKADMLSKEPPVEEEPKELTGRLIKPMEKKSPPEKPEEVKETTATPNNDEGSERSDELIAMQNELEAMKAILLQMGQGGKGQHNQVTLQDTLIENGIKDNVLQDIISKLAGSEILAEKNSDKARKAMKRFLQRYVRLAEGITLYQDKPKVVALIGPTGVGKTTTLAKIAAKFVLEKGIGVALITADTYRISAVEQLKTYSDILGLPLEIVYNPAALEEAIKKHADKQLILIDTAGRSQYNEFQMQELQELLSVSPYIEKHLVMSATTKTRDGVELLENFSQCMPDRVIFTKVDETSNHGIILNILHKKNIALSYLTTGQSVPDDIEPASVERLVELLLR